MERIAHFVPGQQGETEQLLTRLRWPIPPGVTRTYVEAYAHRGDVVVVPYCQGTDVVREILETGRRVLALNFDPVLILLIQTLLATPKPRSLDAAVAQLGDTLKQGVPMRHFVSSLYAVSCPACLRPAVADYFVWDREQEVPIAKHLSCRACAWTGQTMIDAEDRERLSEIPVGGLHYHYLLDRMAPDPESSAIRRRLEPMLALYTHRNLYALAELTIKIDRLAYSSEDAQVLRVLLLDCLDRCSSLTPIPGSTRRNSLTRPSRYVEHNVWQAFEVAITRLQASTAGPFTGLADNWAAYQSSPHAWSGFLGEGLVRDLPRMQSPRSIALILTSPPPLDSVAWSLSYLWGAWALGADAVAALRPLFRQRTPDPAWYARVMTGSFRTLSELLRDDGRLVLILESQKAAVVEALLIAAANARMGLASLAQCGSDYRFEFAPTVPAIESPVRDTPLEALIEQSAVRVARETIQTRGEPATRRTLHAAILDHLAKTGLLTCATESNTETPSPSDMIAGQIEAALTSPVFECLKGRGGQETWWIPNTTESNIPLSDLVEVTAVEILKEAPFLDEYEFSRALFARFPGTLTPARELVSLCLKSVGQEFEPGRWRIRPEDKPEARDAERQAIIKHIGDLGQRLGYGIARMAPFDTSWFDADQPRATFAVRWQATLSDVLTLSSQTQGAIPHLVLPGGRAALVSYKLAHNPLWQKAVDDAGWRFIKYRHVRQMVAQPEVDEYHLRTVIGLDPIVEREVGQIPLF